MADGGQWKEHILFPHHTRPLAAQSFAGKEWSLSWEAHIHIGPCCALEMTKRDDHGVCAPCMNIWTHAP